MEKKRFANGLRVVMESRPYLDTASISVTVMCGSVQENRDESGIAHFVEHMIFRGTKNRDYEDIMNSFQSLGGFVEACTQKTYTIFSVSIIKNFLKEAVNLLFEMIFNPNFRESDLEKERNVILEEIYQQMNDQPIVLRQELFEKIINKGNELSMPVLGNEKSIRSITKNRLLNFHKSHYLPSNMCVSIVGDIKYRAAENVIKNSFGKLKGDVKKPQKLRFKTKQLSHEISKNVKKEGMKQSHLVIGGRAPMFFEGDRYVMELLIAILGNSMNSRIVVRLINKMGIAYSVGSYYNDKEGYYYNYASTSPKNVKKASVAIFEEIDKLVRNGVKKRELEFAKNYIKGFNAAQQESNRIRAEKYAVSELFASANDVVNFNKSIDSVRIIDIKRVIEKYLKQKHIILKLGPG